MPILSSDRLHALIRRVCARAGSDAYEADLVADHLVEANLTGHDSHGVGMLPHYVLHVRVGKLIPNRHAETVSDRGSVLIIDGGHGYGQVIGHEAMQLGMARAAEHGVAMVAIRQTHHLGRIGHWAEQCAWGGFASIHFVNGVHHRPLVAPFGGSDARFLTNPFCVALPGQGGAAVLLDMATSKIAMGKARVFHNRDAPAPEGSVLDADGRPTLDAGAMYREPIGALVAMGEHKGSGLAIVCELMAGALTGGGTIQPEHHREGGIINNMLSIVIDPEALTDPRWLRHEVDALIAWVKASAPRPGVDEVLVPGEPERRRRERRLAEGVDLDERSWHDILVAAREAGLSEEDLDEITG